MVVSALGLLFEFPRLIAIATGNDYDTMTDEFSMGERVCKTRDPDG